MKIDLHIHSQCSDGRMSLEEIFEAAERRGVEMISITDHDSIDCQEQAEVLAERHSMRYLRGLELNVSFPHPDYRKGKPISLDFLGYDYDIHNVPLSEKLIELRRYRRKRAEKILEKINVELARENRSPFTDKDMAAIEESVDGTFGRPHIAGYMVKRGLVKTKQEAFDRYLVKCNVPKMPVSLAEASDLVRDAGGKLVFSHPNHPRGTSLISFTSSIKEQLEIIKQTMLPYLDGIECWHASYNPETTEAYLEFAKEFDLLVTGGSDCHQQPVRIGIVKVPSYVADQFDSIGRAN